MAGETARVIPTAPRQAASPQAILSRPRKISPSHQLTEESVACSGRHAANVNIHADALLIVLALALSFATAWLYSRGIIVRAAVLPSDQLIEETPIRNDLSNTKQRLNHA